MGKSKRKNDIRICHKCKNMSIKSMRSKLKKLDPEARIKMGCQSYCGPCGKAVFVYVNGRYVIGKTEDEAVQKASVYVK